MTDRLSAATSTAGHNRHDTLIPRPRIQPVSPVERLLLGPGPTSVHPRVLGATAAPTVSHIDPIFISIMEEVKELLRYAFQTENAFTVPISGPGSAAMEASFVNLLEPGDKVIICRNGVFGNRMVQIAERCRAVVVAIDDEWGEPVDPEKLRQALQAHPDSKVVAFVHAETSTGVLSDAEALSALAREAGCLTIVDTVTSLVGVPLFIDAWGIDVAYSGSQKCLSCPPGLSPTTFSKAAIDRIRARQTPAQSWFLDVGLLLSYWSDDSRVYHHTAPVNAIYGLREALLMVAEEELPAAWSRHSLHQRALSVGLEALGLELLVAERYRLAPLTTVRIPANIADKTVRAHLLDRFGIEIGAGLGPLAGKVWRIGLMGKNSASTSVLRCLEALNAVLIELGADLAQGIAVERAESLYRSNAGSR
ncbi:MAG: alanine--glyoxylate aminotransferase family protein [Gammaproteobacteria bacterium]|nr:alanine--glyoxylate aminotransferase family protein [Gammaproteobacteria bacterium]MDH3465355.1 alanine--glyoxylate aminotransferase family protein [Gammaproteobacteria bacterium]